MDGDEPQPLHGLFLDRILPWRRTEGADLDRFGARPLLIVDDAGDPVLLPIHACWNPAHYAAESLSAFAEQLKRFSDTVVRQAAEWIGDPAMPEPDQFMA